MTIDPGRIGKSQRVLVVGDDGTNPDGVNVKVDSTGNLSTKIDQTTLGTTNKVTEAAGYANLSASGQVKGSAGTLVGIFVASASATPTIKVWDNTSAATTILVNTFTPIAGTFYPMPFKFGTGCYVTIGGTVDCTVAYD